MDDLTGFRGGPSGAVDAIDTGAAPQTTFTLVAPLGPPRITPESSCEHLFTGTATLFGRLTARGL